MHGYGLETLPGRGPPASVSLEEGYKDSETQITLSDTQSVAVWASCMTFELLPQSLCRPLDWMDANLVSQALGTIMTGQVVLFHSVGSGRICKL